jgi:hypothetical protein
MKNLEIVQNCRQKVLFILQTNKVVVENVNYNVNPAWPLFCCGIQQLGSKRRLFVMLLNNSINFIRKNGQKNVNFFIASSFMQLFK